MTNPTREKVIQRLRDFSKNLAYQFGDANGSSILKAAIAMLEGQEVEITYCHYEGGFIPEIIIAPCPKCKYTENKFRDKHCSMCGARITWRGE